MEAPLTYEMVPHTLDSGGQLCTSLLRKTEPHVNWNAAITVQRDNSEAEPCIVVGHVEPDRRNYDFLQQAEELLLALDHATIWMGQPLNEGHSDPSYIVSRVTSTARNYGHQSSQISRTCRISVHVQTKYRL